MMEQNLKTTHHGAQKVDAKFKQEEKGHDKVKKTDKDLRCK